MTNSPQAAGNTTRRDLKWIRPADEVPGYLFVKYTVEGESLAFSLIEFDIVENAIKNGSLKGLPNQSLSPTAEREG